MNYFKTITDSTTITWKDFPIILTMLDSLNNSLITISPIPFKLCKVILSEMKFKDGFLNSMNFIKECIKNLLDAFGWKSLDVENKFSSLWKNLTQDSNFKISIRMMWHSIVKWGKELVRLWKLSKGKLSYRITIRSWHLSSIVYFRSN